MFSLKIDFIKIYDILF